MVCISTAAPTDLASEYPNLSDPSGHRVRLLASSMPCGGSFRSLAVAAAMVTALGISPAFAQCLSTATGFTGGAACAATLAGASSLAVGGGANASSNFATALGAFSDAGGASTAVGRSAVATSSATAVGNFSSATGDSSTAVGQGSQATADFASAYGQNSRATVTNASAFGRNSLANGAGATAMGANSTASGASSIAMGDTASATAVNAIAMGTGATATFANSTAIGNGATTTRANQQTFGTAANTYTMAGLTSAASLAAQTGPVSLVTTDAAGNLASMSTAGLATVGSVAALDSRVTSLENNVNNLNFNVRKAFEGAAVAIAMGGSALPDNKRFAISANWGNFGGENAFGGMAQMRISNNFVANAAVGAGFARGGVGGRVGGTFAW